MVILMILLNMTLKIMDVIYLVLVFIIIIGTRIPLIKF